MEEKQDHQTEDLNSLLGPDYFNISFCDSENFLSKYRESPFLPGCIITEKNDDCDVIPDPTDFTEISGVISSLKKNSQKPPTRDSGVGIPPTPSKSPKHQPELDIWESILESMEGPTTGQKNVGQQNTYSSEIAEFFPLVACETPSSSKKAQNQHSTKPDFSGVPNKTSASCSRPPANLFETNESDCASGQNMFASSNNDWSFLDDVGSSQAGPSNINKRAFSTPTEKNVPPKKVMTEHKGTIRSKEFFLSKTTPSSSKKEILFTRTNKTASTSHGGHSHEAARSNNSKSNRTKEANSENNRCGGDKVHLLSFGLNCILNSAFVN